MLDTVQFSQINSNKKAPITDHPQLQTNGFEQLPSYLFRQTGPLQTDKNFDKEIKLARKEFDILPSDPYGLSDNRFRCHSRAVFFPWSNQIEWLPCRIDDNGVPLTEYYQGAFHPDFLNKPRIFQSASNKFKNSALLKHLIQYDFNKTFWNEFHIRQPLQLGVSLLKLYVPPGQKVALSTPDTLHQDGETFTFAHLIHRENCDGGENVIAAPIASGQHPNNTDKHLIETTFTLENPLDSYAIHDPDVSHYVSGVKAINSKKHAQRCILLIDFTPLIAVHQN